MLLLIYITSLIINWSIFMHTFIKNIFPSYLNHQLEQKFFIKVNVRKLEISCCIRILIYYLAFSKQRICLKINIKHWIMNKSYPLLCDIDVMAFLSNFFIIIQLKIFFCLYCLQYNHLVFTYYYLVTLFLVCFLHLILPLFNFSYIFEMLD